jgi:hypothetical protein
MKPRISAETIPHPLRGRRAHSGLCPEIWPINPAKAILVALEVVLPSIDTAPRQDSFSRSLDPWHVEGAPRGPFERRRRRSDDLITALHYQLSSVRTEAQIEALVLVDECGCLVAGAGAWPVCEELAAYAPLLARPGVITSATLGSRIAALSSEVLVRTLDIDGAEALICGSGGGEGRADSIARAAVGCCRILGADASAQCIRSAGVVL